MEMQEICPFGARWPFGRTRVSVSNEEHPTESGSNWIESRDSLRSDFCCCYCCLL